MKVNVSISEFRKNFESYFKGFILRIRKKEGNIAYYNGIKAFEIKSCGDKTINIVPSLDTCRCNVSSVIDDLKNNIDLRTNIVELCKSMESFFKFKMPRIGYINATKSNEKELKKRIEDFTDVVNKLYPNINIKCSDNDNKSTKEGIIHYLEIDKYESMTIEQIINIQYLFIIIVRLTNTIKVRDLIKFQQFDDFTSDDVEIDKPFTLEDVTDLTNPKSFISCITKAIDNYVGKECLEKKYQHQFMLYGNKIESIFGKDSLNNISYFEQEYGIKNHTNSESAGRVDCVFYKYKNDSNIIKVTDIYFVELKVNEDVILGDNGVLTHLDDIRDFLMNESYKDDNLKRLKEYIVYRINSLYGKDVQVQLDDIGVHFYTVVGFTKAESRVIVEEYLKGLNNKEQVKIWADTGKIDSYFKESSIQDIRVSMPNCDVKFFFEKKDWDVDSQIGTEFEEKLY